MTREELDRAIEMQTWLVLSAGLVDDQLVHCTGHVLTLPDCCFVTFADEKRLDTAVLNSGLRLATAQELLAS